MNIAKEFVIKNKTAFAAAAAVYFAGLIMGSVFACRLDAQKADELRAYIVPYLAADTASNLSHSDIFAASALAHLRFVAVALICSVSIFLLPLFIFAFGLNGYRMGFAISFVADNFGTGGIALALSSALVSCLLAMPMYVLIFVTEINSAKRKIQPVNGDGKNERRDFLAFAFVLLLMYFLLCISSAAEAWVTPFLIGIMN